MRKTDYLYRQAGSANWHIRLQFPKALWDKFGREKRRSLGTPDRKEAEVRALPLIHKHKLMLLTIQRMVDGAARETEGVRYEPGREHRTPQGERVLATTTGQLIYLDEKGTITRTEANQPVVQISFKTTPQERREVTKYRPKTPNPDDAILETWIKDKNVSGFLEQEARTVWDLFRTITNNKPLKQCNRDDGRKLAQHLLDTGNKSKTVQKKIGHLNAAVNIAIDEGKLSFNPFSKVVPKLNDKSRRLPLDEDDMAIMRAVLPSLNRDEWLLWMWLATTGMRRGEPFQIVEEFREDSIRYVMFGTKSEPSERRVPIPDAMVPLLPRKITGPLFKRDPRNVGRNLLRTMRSLGISDERKVLHSLRHRAKDRLRAASCPLDIQYHLLGHEEDTVAADYGRGYPMRILKGFVEKIGF
ncbi:DUF6538 domain-containing protein [Microvirga sp. GCM10011540]|uniref:DUF6538 domain-containing protein n=1 Tax=Microvirga sp. GCM10011540 TaxID=3317338 RepID=UPI003608676B